MSDYRTNLIAISGSIKLVLSDKTKSKMISDLKNMDKQINQTINSIK